MSATANLECQSCKHQTRIPPDDLQGLSARLRVAKEDERFVNFVCPECGQGRQYILTSIPICGSHLGETLSQPAYSTRFLNAKRRTVSLG